ncbi:type 2 phosphatidylinositol 4,5-bisphosphate 4-phosphatase isoform X3 [Rhinatrema bivittatum]|uniref:type 2 phosphatidylinositol 4,5-bisphosphate 4-phosphatase isoform X3 n=1 Tax=Rhinatrema bivittatum TaxID=194408 RepID=UPI00112E28C4|nr:type 2 phosphatidylinositol 4,5-bisphosphate 4-phosphatase isoform X3 [Rhinatrema bivittatum]
MAADGADERSPLLSASGSGSVTPSAPPYITESNLRAELPPPYTAIASPDASGVPVINCRVCQSLINLDGKLHQHVVKCTVCSEATPIKNPPSGKKYVRCPCNCLLICKDTSRRIGCPRPNCRRIINLGPVMLIPEEQPAQPALPVQAEGTRVVCGHCGNTFLWMELRFNTLAKCPHCKKISSVGSALPRRRCCAYITIGMIFIFVGVGLTYGTSMWITSTMETKKLIRRSLQPARPLRRLSSEHERRQKILDMGGNFQLKCSSISTFSVDFPAEFPPGDQVCLHDKVSWWPTDKKLQVLAETEISSQPAELQSHDNKERIRYSRDFLMELSSLSISKQKPEYLPDHPVVLQKSMNSFRPWLSKEDEKRH